MKLKYIYKIAAMLLFVVIVLHLCFMFLFYNSNQNPFYEGTNKKWSHRGVSINCSENTICSIQEALNQNYSGVEIDVWFYNQDLIVRHDRNSSAILTLNEVFEKFPNSKFWIDLKNLNSNNVDAITELFLKLKLKNSNFIIESKNAYVLSKLYQKGFKCCLWLSPSKSVFSKSFLKEIYNKYLITCYKFNAISMPLQVYNSERVMNEYGHLNIHLWTDLDTNTINYQKISAIEEVKIILDDQEFFK